MTQTSVFAFRRVPVQRVAITGWTVQNERVNVSLLEVMPAFGSAAARRMDRGTHSGTPSRP